MEGARTGCDAIREGANRQVFEDSGIVPKKKWMKKEDWMADLEIGL